MSMYSSHKIVHDFENLTKSVRSSSELNVSYKILGF
jgi:hypothetical protein